MLKEQIRKSALRLATRSMVTIRPLRSLEDVRECHSLRYEVWKQLDYLPNTKHCDAALELDYTDRTAVALGAFSKAGSLFGCIRLVKPLGYENMPGMKILSKLVEESGDPVLAKNIKYPGRLGHPFDVMDVFERFQDYYSGLVRLTKAEVSRVIVRQEKRCQGLGEVLVDTCVDFARSHGINVLFLACREEHGRFYGRCGFIPIPGMRSDQFFNIIVPTIAMHRKLH